MSCKTTPKGCSILLAMLLAACGSQTNEHAGLPESGGDRERPNILLIVVDDMGFSDLGSFGGEIQTPNLDRLALEGIRFTNFHGAMTCSPSRAMMLTGVDPHLSGLGNMLEELSPNQKGRPGYEGYLNDRVVTVASLLRDAGYRTFLSGKWHLGSGDSAGPLARGFDHAFSLASGGASHFSDMRPAYAPAPEIKADYWEDGIKLTALPDSFDYSSEFYVDRMIDYLDTSDSTDAPFFAYLSFTAPHWPLQAPDAAIARHKGKYDIGYDVIATRRLARLKTLGLIPQQAKRSGRSPREVAWETLSDGQRKTEIRAMEVYAAMIDEVDRHTGRLLKHLESNGHMDNTVVLFLSDNGPEGHDLDETWPMEAFPAIRRTIDATHDFSLENMGRVGSYTLYGPNWANAVSPAFRLHKAFPTEGGTRVAAFIHYPPKISAPGIIDDYVSVIDVTPTILELAGVAQPGTSYDGRPVQAISGRSFVSMLDGNADPDPDQTRVSGIELFGKRAIRAGRWKLVHMPEPWGTDEWQLFDLRNDLGESHDVSDEYPERVAQLKAAWQAYADASGVIIPDWVSGY